MRLVCALGLLLAATGVRAEPATVLRLATVAPEGSGWAHELLADYRVLHHSAP